MTRPVIQNTSLRARLTQTALLLCASLAISTMSSASQLEVAFDDGITAPADAESKREPNAELRAKIGKANAVPAGPPGPNPFLSFLPAESSPDFSYWREKLTADAVVRNEARKKGARKSVNPLALLAVGEAEPVGVRGTNDSQATAQAIGGFGTGSGDDPEADVSGNLATPNAPTTFTPLAEDEGDIFRASPTLLTDGTARTAGGVIGDGPFGSVAVNFVPIGPFAEDDGNITIANVSGATTGNVVVANGEIGDGPFGSQTGTPSGDFDVYSMSVTAPQTVVIEVNRQAGELTFDPIVGLADSTGTIVTFNDDNGVTVESALSISFTCPNEPCGAQTYYVFVGGYSANEFPGNFPGDTSDSSTGPGAGSEGLYELSIAMSVFRSGDFDFYSFNAVAGDVINVEIDTSNYGGVLDPIVALYDGAGNFVALNDDDPDPLEGSFDSRILINAPITGPYYIAVAGFNPAVQPTSPLSFLTNPFDSSSGPGTGSEGNYDIIASINNVDTDFYAFDLEAGDIIGLNLTGAQGLIGLFDINDDLLVATPFENSGIYPASSPLPGGGNASSAYLVSETGTYTAAVAFSEGAYGLELRAFRPPQEATGLRQKLFLDFDGATVDTSKFGAGGAQPSVLSPLSSFLAGWGLTGADEDAVIDAILAVVEANLDTDIKLTGANPKYDIEILNSRDDADVYGDPDVSRIIVGGTIAESGISTIGIAQSIDIGNYDQAEDSLVLLDLLSAPAGDPNSLNSIPLGGGATIIDIIGVGVGNVIAHEAGHYFANFHTDSFNAVPNLQDSGGNMPAFVGVGPDGIFGTGDDNDVDFITDDYAPEESFTGMEDTKNALAFGLTANSDVLPLLVTIPDVTADAIEDVAVIREASIVAEIRSGANGALQRNITFFTEFAATPVDAVALPDSDGNGVAELAILATRDSDGRIVAEVRNLAGDQAPRYVWFTANHTAYKIKVVEDDADDNGIAELAVMSTRNSDGRIVVEVKNAFGPTNTNTLWYMSGNTPVDLEVVPDKDSDGTPEIAVLSYRNSDGRIVTELKNAAGATAPTSVWFMPGNSAIDLVAVDDKDANGVPEVAVLSSRNSDGRNVVEIKNAAGATAPTAVWFMAGNTATNVAHVQDADNNGVPEVAVLSIRDSDDRIVVEVKNVTGATNPNTMWYSTGFAARGLDVLADSDSNSIEEALVLMIRDSDGRILVQARNTAGNPAPIQYWFSP